jgi:hypothetical protein
MVPTNTAARGLRKSAGEGGGGAPNMQNTASFWGFFRTGLRSSERYAIKFGHNYEAALIIEIYGATDRYRRHCMNIYYISLCSF